MSQKRQTQVPDVELQQEHRQDQESTNKRARGAEGKEQQQQQDPGLDVNCKQSINLLPPPPQDDDPIITQFRPVEGQWELNDDNIKRIGPTTGETILNNYCQYINTTPIEVYRYLIETKGCNINVRGNDTGNTPLHRAFEYFNPDNDDELGDSITVLRYLLSQCDIEANIEDEHGYTVLHYACKNINNLPLDVFKVMIETYGLDVNAQDVCNDTPIHSALDRFNPQWGGDINVLTYLFNQMGIDGNIKGQWGFNLLHYACNNINALPIDIFKVLIETMGCDVNAQNDDNDTPIHSAFRSFDPNDGGDINVLHYLLSQKGVNANIKGDYDYTILHTACDNIKRLPLEIFKLLIETMGCDINAQANYNDTPIRRALYFFDPNNGGDITVLTYLLNQKGVNVNFKGKDGDTILHWACDNIKRLPLEIFKILLETVGCDINAQANNNDTPIHRALYFFDPNDGGNITVLTYLLSQKSVNGNIKGKDGYSLLHTACQKINNLPLDIFKLLIETHGLDVNAQDDYNNTPVCLAFRAFNPRNGGDITVLTYLINQNNVNLNIQNEEGRNLLHTTCINNLPSYRRSVELDAENDTVFCQIVEMIAERCIQQVLDKITS